MTSRSPQLTTLQAVRALAAFAVVLHHGNTVLAAPKYWGHEISPYLEPAYSGVQFFFVLSGFVILLAHRRDLGHAQTIGSFLWKRFKRIYPPLWIALLLLIPIYFLVHSIGTGQERHLSVIVRALLVSPTTAAEGYLAVEWTLRHEILFYLVFSLALLHKRAGLILCGLWMLLSLILPWTHPPALVGFYFAANHVLFGMGMVVCGLYIRKVFSNSTSACMLAAGLGVFAGTWIVSARVPWIQQDIIFLCFGVGAALAMLGLVNLERNGALRASPSLVYLGDASYAIYLVHYVLLAVLGKFLMNTTLRAWPHLSFMLLVTLATAGGCVFHTLLEAPVTRWVGARYRPTPAS